MLSSLVRLLQSWREYGTAIRELSALSDRELADLGISRSDITGSLVSTPTTDRPLRFAALAGYDPAGSMPLDLMIGRACGPDRNLMRSAAAGRSLAAVLRPAE